MKTRASLAFLSLVALASTQTVQPSRTYKVGDVDAYHITMSMEGAMAMEISMDSSQKVLNVYDNGDAEVETTTSGGHMKGMGMDRDLPTSPVQKMRISKFGTPVGATSGKGSMMGMDFTRSMLKMPQAGMTVGQTVDIDETDPTTKAHTKGTVKLESLKDGVATYVTNMDVSTAAASKPMHMEFTSSVDATSGRPKRVEGKITGMPGPGSGMGITGMTLTMVRKD